MGKGGTTEGITYMDEGTGRMKEEKKKQRSLVIDLPHRYGLSVRLYEVRAPCGRNLFVPHYSINAM